MTINSDEKLLRGLGNDLIPKWEAMKEKPPELTQNLNSLKAIIKDIKETNEEKKKSAAYIGKLKKNGEDFSHIINEQSLLKKKLQTLKSNKIQLEENIRILFSNLSDVQELPPRFISEHKYNPANSENNNNVNILTAKEFNNTIIDEYVGEHRYATPYHFSCWRKIISELFHHDDLSLVAVNQNNRIQGYIPLIRMQSYLFGDFCVSMPYFNYGGPLAENSRIESKLIEAAIETARNIGSEHVEIRELIPRKNLVSKQEKVSMVLSLPKTSQELSSKLGTKLRAQIKRSKQYAPEVKIGKLELIDDFYKVFSINMRDLGTPVYSKIFFQRVIESWYEKSYIVVVYIDNQPVSAALLLGFRELLEIPWASALKKTNKIGINMFMYWNILCHAIDNGYDFFDFGRSSKDSGTYKFKKQWGAVPQQNYWNYWLPEGHEMPQINPNNTKYKLLISTWKKLPVFIANTIGPPIVKNIP